MSCHWAFSTPTEQTQSLQHFLGLGSRSLLCGPAGSQHPCSPGRCDLISRHLQRCRVGWWRLLGICPCVAWEGKKLALSVPQLFKVTASTGLGWTVRGGGSRELWLWETGRDKPAELCRGTGQHMRGSWACAVVSTVPSSTSEPQCNLTLCGTLSQPAFNGHPSNNNEYKSYSVPGQCQVLWSCHPI